MDTFKKYVYLFRIIEGNFGDQSEMVWTYGVPSAKGPGDNKMVTGRVERGRA